MEATAATTWWRWTPGVPSSEPKHSATLKANPRRTFYRMTVKTDLFTSPPDLHHHCHELFQRKARDFAVHRLA
jgi:hypothetical protein